MIKPFRGDEKLEDWEESFIVPSRYWGLSVWGCTELLRLHRKGQCELREETMELIHDLLQENLICWRNYMLRCINSEDESDVENRQLFRKFEAEMAELDILGWLDS